MKIYLLILGVLSLSINLFANPDENPAVNGPTISGIILDKQDSSAIEYATLTLFNQTDSTLITGCYTDENGKYSLTVLDGAKTGYLVVKYIGYDQTITSNINLEEKIIVLPTILLVKNENNLNTVEVTADKALVENKIDKKVYNASQSQTGGGTALDLLANIPSVQVDENDNISLRGQEDVRILIDGRPSNIAASEYLKMIPSESIDKIEIITNPSAKYDAEGMSGIINVITKKNNKGGFSGSINSTYARGENNRANGSILLNYKVRKFNFQGGYSINDHTSNSTSYTRRDVILQDSTVDRLDSDGLSRDHRFTQVWSSGLDFFANEKNTLYLSGKYINNKSDMIAEVDYQNLDPTEIITSSSERNSTGLSPSSNSQINAGWQNTFGKKKGTIDLDMEYAVHFSEDNESTTESFLNGDFVTSNTNSKAKNSTLISKFDLFFPFDDSTSIETGLRTTYRGQGSDMQIDNFLSADPLLDSSFSNIFQYDQLVMAGYFSFQKQIKKFGVKVGMRGEYTMTYADQQTDNFSYRNNYFKLFPSMHLSYNLAKNSDISFNYGKRINRPQRLMLNPLIYYSDRYLYQQGNPYLKPEVIHVMELGYSKYSKKFNLNASVYHRIIRDKNRRYLRQEGELSIISYKDVALSHLTGAEISLTYKPVKSLSFMININAWSVRLKDSLITQNEIDISQGGTIDFDIFLRLKKDWSFQLRNYFSPRYPIQQGYMQNKFIMAISASKKFFNKKLRASVYVSDILNTQRSVFRTYPGQGYSFYGNWKRETRVAYFSLNWTFGSQSKDQKRKKVDKNAGDHNSSPGM